MQGLFHDVCQVQRHSSNEDFKIWVPSGGHVLAPPGCVGPAPPPASSTWAILKLEKKHIYRRNLDLVYDSAWLNSGNCGFSLQIETLYDLSIRIQTI